MVGEMQDPPVRRSRAEARAQTRQAVMDAASAVFLETGFAASSMEDVARRAGFTRGALYSNFADKDDLFLALMDARMEERVADLTHLLSTSSPLSVMDDLRAWDVGQPGDEAEGWIRLFTEFRAHALRNESVRRRLVARERDLRGAYQRAIEAQFSALGLTPPVPAAVLATIAYTLDVAIPVEQLLDPEAAPDGFFFDALSLLFRATVALSAAGAPPPAED